MSTILDTGFNIKPDDYVVVKILRAGGTTLHTQVMGLTTLSEYYRSNSSSNSSSNRSSSYNL
jgi:hypothetical protein